MSGILPAEIELVIEPRPRDLGGLAVRRLLPSTQRRMVGPFIFLDHFGPAQMPVGAGLDVRPHPHIGLGTVTYLLEGEIVHRDSLGFTQVIRPGDVNWMSAGRGIVHSERSPAEARAVGPRVHGIQSWIALPLEVEESEPSFHHHPARTLPRLQEVAPGVVIDVIAGTAYGARAPVAVPSPTLYAHVQLAAGARLPIDGQHEERAIYVVEGALTREDGVYAAGTLVVLRPGAEVVVTSPAPARLLLIGGARLVGERFIDWNFVASSRARIERAKDDWRAGRFARVPGDDEWIPLPPDR